MMRSSSVAGVGNLHAKDLTGVNGLQCLREDWIGLIERGAPGGISVSYSWYEALLRYRHQAPGDVHFFCIRSSDGPALAICPLERRTRKIRRVPFACWSLPSDPDRPLSAFVIDPTQRAESFLPVLTAALRVADPRASIMVLDRMEAGNPTSDMVMKSGDILQTEPRPALFRMPVGASGEQLLERVSSKFRRNIRWGWRRMEKSGPIDYRIAREARSLEPALAAFLELEASGWKGTTEVGRPILARPGVERHARESVRLLGSRGECEIHGLWRGERCLASLVCFRAGDEVFAFKIARDEEFAAFSLGHLLVHQLFNNCSHRSEIEQVNFGWEAGWMTPWNGILTPLSDAYVSLGGPRAGLARLLLSIGHSNEAAGSLAEGQGAESGHA